jgi:hypothetical protein
MVAAWSVDPPPARARYLDAKRAGHVSRLGRSLKNLIEVLSELHAKGVDLYVTPSALARSIPARTRSRIMARSNSANTPIICSARSYVY